MNCAEKLLEPTIFFNLYTKVSLITHTKGLYKDETMQILLLTRGETM